MSKETTNQQRNDSIVIEDLTIEESDADNLKGGPIEIRELTYRAVITERQQ